jgi:hypothetical protein
MTRFPLFLESRTSGDGQRMAVIVDLKQLGELEIRHLV